MSEAKQITALHVITDTENGYENIGDIDGGYIDTEWLKQHIKLHGISGLCKQIAYMNFQVFKAMKEVNSETDTSAAGIVFPLTKP